jgi:predicted GIY-YIG superfamily endonuclease
LNRRMMQHENGHAQTTKNMGSISLVLSQEFPTLDDARKIERKIKRLKRKDYVEK